MPTNVLATWNLPKKSAKKSKKLLCRKPRQSKFANHAKLSCSLVHKNNLVERPKIWHNVKSVGDKQANHWRNQCNPHHNFYYKNDERRKTSCNIHVYIVALPVAM